MISVHNNQDKRGGKRKNSGRKRTSEEKKLNAYTIRLTEKTIDAIELFAKKGTKSARILIRDIIDRYVVDDSFRDIVDKHITNNRKRVL